MAMLRWLMAVTKLIFSEILPIYLMSILIKATWSPSMKMPIALEFPLWLQGKASCCLA